MYCPKCSHEPSSDGLQFCPSCGFRLDGVADLLARDGIIGKEQNKQPRRSLVKRGILFGMTLMFIGALLITYGTPRGAIRGETLSFLTLFWAVLVIMVSMSGLLKRAIDKVFPEGHPSSPIEGSAARNPALPPAQSVAITNTGHARANTSPVEQPASVTEHTTTFLDHR